MHVRALTAIVVLLALLAPHSMASTGAYAGTGPSVVTTESGRCINNAPAHVVLSPSTRGGGMWALDIAQPYAPLVLDSCGGLSTGYHGWPGYATNNLVGTPESGFTASGTSEIIGTSPGALAWDIVVGPVGLETEWVIHTYFVPQYPGSPASHQWWNGTTALVGAHL